jgi:hypothetical protein
MAYVGTPLDTTNAFQSLAGKRFNGDGSTTDFTLDSSPNSTLDIEVFVGNVRQDPNSAYTVSGTTLAFTGAPPSGTNNIYVVHQAKAVGTIDPAVGSTLDLNGAAELVLDADADTAISADAADDQIDIKIGGNDDFKLTAKTLSIGGAAAADSKIVFDGNAQDFHIGLDDSADDLVIGLGSTLGTTSHIVIDEAGHVTKPLQPAFMANKSASGQTPSASTAVTIVFENEVFDNNADYNTTNSTFTAPVTGRYWFHTRIRTDQVGGGTGIYSIRLVASNRTIHNTQVDLSDYLDGTMDRMSFEVTGLLDMDASDTCKVQVYEDSGYEIEDEVEETFFMGYLVC